MAGHSRPKDRVLSHAYVPAIHAFLACCGAGKTWMPATSAGMTDERRCHSASWPGIWRAIHINVMAGLVPAIHVFLACCVAVKTWMPATSAGMTFPVSSKVPGERALDGVGL